MSSSRAISTLAAALAIVATACGLDLTRRDGELSVVLLDNESFRDAEAVIRVEHDDVASETRHDVANEIFLESVPAGSCRVSAVITGHALVSNRQRVYIYETTRASIGLTFFAASAGADDDDSDGVDNLEDNCITVANPEQSDEDHDGVGDGCDNCPAFPHPLQTNSDGDVFGDLCDPDIDGDGALNVQDACPRDAGGSIDSDGDRVCDGSDTCPNRDNPTQDDCDGDGLGDACDTDIDGDGIANDASDNCPFAWNPSQQDGNGDGI
ncbi:MAG TPA: thrombospondin type 3 repeat-containing protein, partial [Myxococcota bacterium]|nr:thrombospondin type 3 repeat-containing protein [Myxococcota bacterium]